MPEQSTDPVRDLVRRAYDMDDDGIEDDLRDVVSRAALPRVQVRTSAPRRRSRTLAVVATFAAAIVTIFAAATAAGHLGGGHLSPPGAASVSGGPDRGSSGPSNPRPARADPFILPSNCAAAWDLALTGSTFTVSTRPDGSCPRLPVARLWLIDAAAGNGAIYPGEATIWPITPAGTSATTRTAPFSFTVKGGWGGPVHGHLYSVWFLSVEESQTAPPGGDASQYFQDAYGISLTAAAP